MGMLEGIKRRLLGGSNRGSRSTEAGSEAGPASAAASVTSSAGSPSPSLSAALPPAQWPASFRSDSTTQPAKPSPALALPSPRRVPLGGLPLQLAALQQRFAELPVHHSPSKEALAARLAAGSSVPKHGVRAGASKAAAKSPLSRSPRKGSKLAKSLRRPTLRSSLRRQPSVVGAAAVGTPRGRSAPPSPPTEPPAAGDGVAAKRSQRSKLAQLKQRQVLRSTDGSRPATATPSAFTSASPSPGSSPGFWAAEEDHSSHGLAERSESSASSWGPSAAHAGHDHSRDAAAPPASQPAPEPGHVQQPPQQPQQQRELADNAGKAKSAASAAQPTNSQQRKDGGRASLTPRILVAATAAPAGGQHQPRLQPASSAGPGRISGGAATGAASASRPAARSAGGGHSSHSSHGTLSLTLAPWAAAPGEGSSMPGSPAVHPAGKSSSGAAALEQRPAASPQQLQRPRLPSRAELPVDLLSLRESASLARSGSLSAPRLGHGQRRALSMQEPGEQEAQRAAEAAAQPGNVQGALASNVAAHSPAGHVVPVLPASEAVVPRPGAQRLAALRHRRQLSWSPDAVGSVPAWRHSQEAEAAVQLPPLATSAFQGAVTPAQAAPLPAAAERRPVHAADAPVADASGALQQQRHPQQQQQQLQQQEDKPRVQQEQQAEQPVAARPKQRGVTHAQLRQQEAWGSLGALSLGDMLKQPARGPGPLPPDRENVGSNGSSPTAAQLQPSPKAEQPGAVPVGATAAARQGRRKTAPHPSFVESLERLAALNRARSDSEQREGGGQWQLPPVLRQSRSPPRPELAQPVPAAMAGRQPDQRLPPLQRAPSVGVHAEEGPPGAAAQLPELRSRPSTGFLANSRHRGTWKQAQQGGRVGSAEQAAGKEEQLVQGRENSGPASQPAPQREQQTGQGETGQAPQHGHAEEQQRAADQWQQQWQQQQRAVQPVPVHEAAVGQYSSVAMSAWQAGQQGQQQLVQPEQYQYQPPQQQQWYQGQTAAAHTPMYAVQAGTSVYGPPQLPNHPAYLGTQWQQPAQAPGLAAQPALHRQSVHGVQPHHTGQPAQGAPHMAAPPAHMQSMSAAMQHGAAPPHQALPASQAMPAHGPSTAAAMSWWQQQQQQQQQHSQQPAHQPAALQYAWQQAQQGAWQQQQQQQQLAQSSQYVAASGRRRWQVPASSAPQAAGQMWQLPPSGGQHQPAHQPRASVVYAQPAYWQAQAGAGGVQPQQGGAAYQMDWHQQKAYYQAAYGSGSTGRHQAQQQQQQQQSNNTVLPQLPRQRGMY